MFLSCREKLTQKRGRWYRGGKRCLVSVLLGGTSIVLALLAGCRPDAKPPAEDLSNVLATVGNRRISVEDFVAEVARRGEAGRPVQDKTALLDEMIAREALLQRARALAVQDDPDVRHEMERVLIARLKDRELLPRLDAATVSDEEVRAAYDRNITTYTRPAMVRLAMLHLKIERGASGTKRAEVRARMDEARRRALANPAPGGRGAAAGGFGALAIEFSEDQTSRYRGGDLGWMEEETLSPRWPRIVLEAGFKLAKGDVSEVIEEGDGLYVIMKSDMRDAIVRPFDEVAVALRQSLSAQKRRDLQKVFVDEVMALAAPEVNRDVLAAVTVRADRGTLASAKGKESPPRLPAAMGGAGNEL